MFKGMLNCLFAVWQGKYTNEVEEHDDLPSQEEFGFRSCMVGISNTHKHCTTSNPNQTPQCDRSRCNQKCAYHPLFSASHCLLTISGIPDDGARGVEFRRVALYNVQQVAKGYTGCP